MLFLALICGFLAEYQLEHTIEHQREKQHMQSLVYDLQNDTTNLNAGFSLKDKRLLAIDSIFLFFEKDPNSKKIPFEVFKQFKRSLWDRHYRRNSISIHINTEHLNQFLNFSADQKTITSLEKRANQAIEKSAERLIAMIKKNMI